MLRLFLSKRFFAATTLKQFENLFQNKRYKAVLGVKNDAKIDQIKAKFYVLIKKYHPDTNPFETPEQRLENSKISKILIIAYEQIMREEGGKPGQDFTSPKEQDFARYYRPKPDTAEQPRAHQQPDTSSSPVLMLKFLKYVVLGGFLIGSYNLISHLRHHKNVENIVVGTPITRQRMDKIIEIDVKKKQDRKNELIAGYVREQPPTLFYPSYGDVDIYTQLKKYSILFDITLYEISPRFFNPQQYTVKFFRKRIQKAKCPISNIKVNTIMTLALQAERCLHNTYVNRADLLRQLKQKGYYEPPAFMFRFYGYVFFKLRDKPLNLANYKGQQWISIFDLYFRYYSPIFIRKNKYNQYSALNTADHPKQAQKSNEHFIGSVHINHRPMTPVFLKPNQKLAMLWRQPPNMSNDQNENEALWTHYYSHRISKRRGIND